MNQKLSTKDVVEIRRLYATGLYSQTHLALSYDLSQQGVSDIIRGRRWPLAPGPITRFGPGPRREIVL